MRRALILLTLIQPRLSVLLAIVRPFYEDEVETLLDSFGSWPNRSCLPEFASDAVDLIFYYSGSYETKIITALDSFGSQYLLLKACFRNIRYLAANLTDSENTYPAGPSFQFYKLFLPDSSIAAISDQYDFLFWMEADVFPIREFWINELLFQSRSSRCNVKGSMYRGTSWDGDGFWDENGHDMFRWARHINGNALYKINTNLKMMTMGAFTTFPPDTGIPFDTALYMITHDIENHPNLWLTLKENAHLYCYSDFILNIGGEFHVKHDSRSVADRYDYTFLVHGSHLSTGSKLYGGALQKQKPPPPTQSFFWVRSSAFIFFLFVGMYSLFRCYRKTAPKR